MTKTANLKPFLPGQSGNPAGRKTGSRVKLSEAFLAALHDDFARHGKDTIERVRIEKPDAYLKVIASILPKQIELAADPFEGIPDDELEMIVHAAAAAIRAHYDDDQANEERVH